MMRRIVGILAAVGKGKSDLATLAKYINAFDQDEHCNEKIPHSLLEVFAFLVPTPYGHVSHLLPEPMRQTVEAKLRM